MGETRHKSQYGRLPCQPPITLCVAETILTAFFPAMFRRNARMFSARTLPFRQSSKEAPRNVFDCRCLRCAHQNGGADAKSVRLPPGYPLVSPLSLPTLARERVGASLASGLLVLSQRALKKETQPQAQVLHQMYVHRAGCGVAIHSEGESGESGGGDGVIRGVIGETWYSAHL